MTEKKAPKHGKFPIKALSILLLVALICTALYFGGSPDSAMIRALPKYQSRTVAKNGEWFGGRMEYAQYTYEKLYSDQVEESGYFTLIDYEILTQLKGFTEDFEKRVEEYHENGNPKNREFASLCCFYTENAEEGDYCYLKTVPETAETVKDAKSYTVYYVEVSEKTVYYLYAEISK